MTVGEGSSAGGAVAAKAAAVEAGTVWRYLDLGAIDAFESNAQLPVVVRDVASTGRRCGHDECLGSDTSERRLVRRRRRDRGSRGGRRKGGPGDHAARSTAAGRPSTARVARRRGPSCCRRRKTATRGSRSTTGWLVTSRWFSISWRGSGSRLCSSRDRATCA